MALVMAAGDEHERACVQEFRSLTPQIPGSLPARLRT
jgi:hypothetical protein